MSNHSTESTTPLQTHADWLLPSTHVRAEFLFSRSQIGEQERIFVPKDEI